jgi:hypothetical protein
MLEESPVVVPGFFLVLAVEIEGIVSFFGALR